MLIEIAVYISILAFLTNKQWHSQPYAVHLHTKNPNGRMPEELG